MKDRTSTYPGRVKLVPVEGMENTYTMSWADEPLQEGTPLNKATLLSDTVAAALRLTGEDPTVSDAFLSIENGHSRVHVVAGAPSKNNIEKAGDIWINTGGMPYFMYVSLGLGDWIGVPVVGKTLTTEVFTASTTWTKPSNITGDVRIIVYGGGGAGYVTSSAAGAAGGAGGRMSEYIGTLTESSYAITVGAGGATSGASGGSSSFGTLVSAAGGAGGAYNRGGSGGSGGGGQTGGSGANFGGGSGKYPGSGGTNDGTTLKGGDGVDTTDIGAPNNAKGTGTGGTTYDGYGYGGGGGYGGKGGNGQGSGCGGGGGYGPSGNGGDGASGTTGSAGKGGYGAGGGGCYYNSGLGAGGDGIVIIQYYK